MRFFSILFLILVSSVSHAEERCLEQHLKDAMLLNRTRLQKYSALTDGASEEISYRLLGFEFLGLFPGAFLDDQAESFQKEGISIVCDELVSMSTVHEFVPKTASDPEPLSTFHPLSAEQVSTEIESAYEAESFVGVTKAAQKWLAVANQSPSYHCLMRHFLDSIVRAANLAPLHVAQAKQVGETRSPADLSWEFIKMQLFGLSEMESIDELAAPIQAQGIPILCQDVPVIPPNL
jgi:hypothetical protein